MPKVDKVILIRVIADSEDAVIEAVSNFAYELRQLGDEP
jgi:hypothetical protein